MAETDLSNLPSTVLLKIFKMLPVSDRGRLGSCSRRLATCMNAATVWADATFVLDLYLVTVYEYPQDHGIGEWVESLNYRDLTLFQKRGHNLQRVHIIMSSAFIDRESLDVLTELAQRGAIKSISLRFDEMISKPFTFFLGIVPSLQKVCLPADMFSPELTTPENDGSVGALVERLHSAAEISVHLDTVYSVRYWPEQPSSVLNFYMSPKPKQFCSLVKRLVLSEVSQSEKELAAEYGSRRLSVPAPTAQLVSSFPNLQELHLNILNMSDQLLLELSGASQKRTRLDKLVIRHTDPEERLTGLQLSSAVWVKLLEACPSLTVECSVWVGCVTHMFDIIRPKVGLPLEKLEIMWYEKDAPNDFNVFLHTKRLIKTRKVVEMFPTLRHIDLQCAFEHRSWNSKVHIDRYVAKTYTLDCFAFLDLSDPPTVEENWDA